MWFLKPMRGTSVEIDCIYSRFARKASWCVVRADKSWAEAERLTDSSCMQRWVASAGFTLLAFACLQLVWCRCQTVIDEYHHLKCKRKRLCEGRHDELPPAGALRDTLSASSSLSLFSFLHHCSPVHPSYIFSPFILPFRCLFLVFKHLLLPCYSPLLSSSTFFCLCHFPLLSSHFC